MTELYKLLNVPRTASVNEIKAAYRLLAKELHPDVNKGSAGKTARFRDIASAYEILSNIESRTKYDRSLGAPEVRRVSNRPYNPSQQRQPYTYTSPSSSSSNNSRSNASAAAAEEYYRRTAGTSHGRIRFNVQEWEAWHYGDQGTIDAIKRRNIYMGVNDKVDPTISKRAQRQAEEKIKSAHQAATDRALANLQMEKIARDNLRASRDARRNDAKDNDPGFCSIS